MSAIIGLVNIGKVGLAGIPVELKGDQTVLWKTVKRNGKPTKVPYQVNGREAKSKDPKTWISFNAVEDCYQKGGYDGVGFMFSHYDPYVGIDLDGCRNPETGEIAEWASEVIKTLNTYAEVSPSGSGLKCFVRGRSPFDTGKKKDLGHPAMGGKNAGIEIYSHSRYFALTGWRLDGLPETPQERNLQWIREEFWPSPKRAKRIVTQPASGPQANVVDGGALGSSDASLRDIRDERRKLPLPRVYEKEDRSQGQVTLDQLPPPPQTPVAN